MGEWRRGGGRGIFSMAIRYREVCGGWLVGWLVGGVGGGGVRWVFFCGVVCVFDNERYET